jgi:hypothetical protein
VRSSLESGDMVWERKEGPGRSRSLVRGSSKRHFGDFEQTEKPVFFDVLRQGGNWKGSEI